MIGLRAEIENKYRSSVILFYILEQNGDDKLDDRIYLLNFLQE